MKHATTLRSSNQPEKALALSGKDYKKTNIDFKIQEYLKAFTSEHSVEEVCEEFAVFIMATNIGLFICIYLQQYFISVSSWNKNIVGEIFRANSCEI